MPRLIEITATYKNERHRFANPDGDVVIAEAAFVAGEKPESVNGGPITIKGPADIDDLRYQFTYRFFGQWTEYKNKRTGITESQFAFQSFVPAAPHGRAGVIAYLTKAGKGNGIGQARARTLYDKFGADAVRVLRESPEVAAAAVSGLSDDDAVAASVWLVEQSRLEGVSIDLMELLDKRGFYKGTFKKLIDLFGNRAAEVVKLNPLTLCVRGIPSCTFKKCDSLYLDLGHPPARLKRQALCAFYHLRQATKQHGHTWHPVETAIQGIKASVAGCDLKIERALKLAKRAGIISTARTDGLQGPIVSRGGRLWVADAQAARHESHVAECVAEASREICNWPRVTTEILGLSDHQRTEAGKSLTGPIALFGGSPGTGKTYSAAALVLRLIAIHGERSVAVAAPTGKAAVRITQAMNGYGVPLQATTIHSLLGVDPLTGRFIHNHANPLPCRFIVVDESSMIDTELMSHLLAARSKGTHILFVGDVNQLPPVGPGAPLRDFIAAGLPYGELRELQRTAKNSLIAKACAAIRDGKPWEAIVIPFGQPLDETVLARVAANKDDNLFVLECETPEQAKSRIFDLIEHCKGKGLDSIWECQPIVPVNRRSELSRRELNKIFHQALNPNPPVDNCPFRLKEKIVNTENKTFDVVSDDPDEQQAIGKTRVANGELGEVVVIQEKSMLARLSAPDRTVRIPRGKAAESGGGDSDGNEEDDGRATNTGCSWDLAYSLTVHKYQGSEVAVCATILDESSGAHRVYCREWIYTALSRGKTATVLIGKKSTADRAARVRRVNDRKTLLKERIHRELTELAVGEL